MAEVVNIALTRGGCVTKAADNAVYLSYLKLVSLESTRGKFLLWLLKFEGFVSRLMSKSGGGETATIAFLGTQRFLLLIISRSSKKT